MQTAKAVHGFKRVIVPDCPYCHKEHSHSEGSDGARMADCLQGEYVLDFSSTPNKAFTRPASAVGTGGESDESAGG